jgi:hypothetical protein
MYSIRLIPLSLLVAAFGACGDPDAAPDGGAPVARPGDIGAPAEPTEPPRLPEAPGIVNGGAPASFVDRGACPFECCVYGEWAAVTAVPVYRAERDTSTVAFTLAAGERFTALTGNVHIAQPGIAVAVETVDAGEPAGSVRFEPGDTVYILNHLGEGTYNLWRNGEVIVGEGFWGVMPLSGGGPLGRLLREPVSDWWVQVRDESGRGGWISMNRLGQDVTGNDACS